MSEYDNGMVMMKGCRGVVVVERRSTMVGSELLLSDNSKSWSNGGEKNDGES